MSVLCVSGALDDEATSAVYVAWDFFRLHRPTLSAIMPAAAGAPPMHATFHVPGQLCEGLTGTSHGAAAAGKKGEHQHHHQHHSPACLSPTWDPSLGSCLMMSCHVMSCGAQSRYFSRRQATGGCGRGWTKQRSDIAVGNGQNECGA